MPYIETHYLGEDGKIHVEKVPCGECPKQYKIKKDDSLGQEVTEQLPRNRKGILTGPPPRRPK